MGEATTTRLLESLEQCGEALPESHRPSIGATPNLLAGLLYWLETGTLEPPEPVAAEAQIKTAEQVRIEQLEAELAAARESKPPIAPSPVAPAPPSPSGSADPAPASPGAGATSPVDPPSATRAEDAAPPISDVPSKPAE
jgi:hypothetical protein